MEATAGTTAKPASTTAEDMLKTASGGDVNRQAQELSLIHI